jgi:hypothetical protein
VAAAIPPSQKLSSTTGSFRPCRLSWPPALGWLGAFLERRFLL